MVGHSPTPIAKGVRYWTRPGKDEREGISASVGYAGTDMLYVWTTALDWLPADRGYDRFGYMVHRDFGGDFRAAGQSLARRESQGGVSVAGLVSVNQTNPNVAPAGATDPLESILDDDSERTRYELLKVDFDPNGPFWNADLNDADFLIEPLIARGRGHALYAGAKTGKALDIETQIPTPDGWIKMGDLTPGDLVMAADGTPTSVLWVSPIYTDHQCFEVEFADGAKIVADAEHLWSVRDDRGRTRTEQTVALAQKISTGRGRSVWSIPVASPLDLPESPLPVDPYVLGYWLGDGTSSSGYFTCHKNDQPWLYEKLSIAGLNPHSVKHELSVSTNGLMVQLRDLGVLNNKHIPAMYQRASAKQRLALLQGLMDSDGTCAEDGQCEFCVVSERLALDVFKLMCSLGLKVKWKEGRSKWGDKDYGPRFRLFTVPEFPAFTLPRKVARQKLFPSGPSSERRSWRGIKNITEVSSRPVRCIAVDHPDRLFLAGESMIVTHNSYIVLHAIAAACIPGHKAWVTTLSDDPVSIVYLDYEMTEADLRERLEMFGYGPKDDYSHLHYIKAGALGADLDTYEGGQDLTNQAKAWGAQLVIVDTLSRAVRGEENDADTIRDFYRFTGTPLKANGIAVLRLDHAGKEAERGQRGTSGKNDDVDVVWRLDRTDDGAKLTNTHSRVFWMPSEITLRYEEDADGVHNFTQVQESQTYTSGTAERADKWLALGIPLNASRRQARDAGFSCKNDEFASVKRYLRLNSLGKIDDLIGGPR